jgi:hypothetical protein
MVDIPDLWPSGIAEVQSIVTPFAILKRQAAALGDKTQGLITAEVARTTDADGDFRYTFYLVSPTANYRYKLFTVYHKPIKLYPITCVFLSGSEQKGDQETFLEWVGMVLASEETQRVVQGLLLQAREEN